MLEIAICDDEPVMRKELSRHFSDYMEKRQDAAYHIRSFESGKQLLACGQEFDLIFLDIQMEEPDGMETAEKLRQKGCLSRLVFVTVLKECVFDAFEVEASGYLMKPLDPRHFIRTMDRVFRQIRPKPKERLLVRRGGQSQVVFCPRVYIAKSRGGKSIFIRKTGK